MAAIEIRDQVIEKIYTEYLTIMRAYSKSDKGNAFVAYLLGEKMEELIRQASDHISKKYTGDTQSELYDIYVGPMTDFIALLEQMAPRSLVR